MKWESFAVSGEARLNVIRDDDAAHGKAAHRPLKVRYIRCSGSRLKAGALAAHARFRLMLLGSPPDMIHEFTLRETGSSTLLTGD